MARWEDCERVAATWAAAGVPTDQEVFGDSPHVQHMLRHPEQYLAALDAFLAKHSALEPIK